MKQTDQNNYYCLLEPLNDETAKLIDDILNQLDTYMLTTSTVPTDDKLNEIISPLKSQKPKIYKLLKKDLKRKDNSG